MAKQNTITPREVKRIAELARINLTEAEAKQAAADLAKILEHFAQIQRIDTSDVPEYDASGLHTVMRSDEAKPQELAEHHALLERAPKTSQGQIQVQAIFKDN